VNPPRVRHSAGWYKAYPPRVIGNPAAGSSNGTGLSERSYYQKCVTNGGNIDQPAPKEKN